MRTLSEITSAIQDGKPATIEECRAAANSLFHLHTKALLRFQDVAVIAGRGVVMNEFLPCATAWELALLKPPAEPYRLKG